MTARSGGWRRNLAILGVLGLGTGAASTQPPSPPTSSAAPGAGSSSPLLNAHDHLVLTQADTGAGRDEEGDGFGAALAAGDFDRDGFSDLAVAAPGEAPRSINLPLGVDDWLPGALGPQIEPGSGAVFVLQGSGGGPTSGRYYKAAITQRHGDLGKNESGDEFGKALATGDFNRDGFADLAVGAPGEAPGSDPKSGAVFLFSGSDAGLKPWRVVTQRDFGEGNEQGDRFGASLAAGDFDGDWYADLAVGAPGEARGPEARAGGVFVFSGSAADLRAERFLDQSSAGGVNAADDGFGAALASGDLNGDGRDELVVGAPNKTSAGGIAEAGRVYVFLGSGAGLATGTSIGDADAGRPSRRGGSFGKALAIGDLNGDGKADLAVGAPGGRGPGMEGVGIVALFPGAPGGIGAGMVVDQEDGGGASASADRFGASVGFGDLNGDGRADLAVGAPGKRVGSTSGAGRVYVFPGGDAALAPGASVSQSAFGESQGTGDGFGSALVLDDFNGDGAADLAVGVPRKKRGDRPRCGALFFRAGLRTSPVLTHGGLVGAVTDTTARIWARADRPVSLALQYRPAPLHSLPPAAWTTTPHINLTAARDFTGVVDLSGLSPNIRYAYRCVLNGAAQPDSEASFKTLGSVGQPGRFEFAIGADTRFIRSPFPIFDKIAARNPDFMILMGDQIYADHPVLIPDTKAAYRRKYKENWAERHMKGFMRSHPTYMVWDDHELNNNWDDRQTGRYANARAVYDEYQGSHNPPAPGGRVYYSFRVGEAGFFVLDTRSYRSRNGAADNQNKTMLGGDQRQDLLDWLALPGLKFKFIVSSVPWRDQEATPDPVPEPNLPEWAREGWDSDDAWDGFRRERSIIFDFIREHGKGRVVLLSGDQHFASIHEVRSGLYDVNATPLGTKAQDKAATDTGQRCKYVDHRVYGLFSVDTRTQPARLEYDLYNSENEPVARCHLELTHP